VENPLDCDLLVLDETSMVDVLLMHALLKAVPETAALLVVGDVVHSKRTSPCKRARWGCPVATS
jgi:ATP-dependent exoDNAse (exonuclease V) alpha subunit